MQGIHLASHEAAEYHHIDCHHGAGVDVDEITLVIGVVNIQETAAVALDVSFKGFGVVPQSTFSLSLQCSANQGHPFSSVVIFRPHSFPLKKTFE